MTIRGQVARLAVAIAAIWGITAACTAALDFDKLNRVDAGAEDAAGDGNGEVPDGAKPDKAPCVPGGACNVMGQQGECAKGEMVCEGSVGTCEQVVQPAEEACDGADTNCNGQPDVQDPAAHASCGGTKYCDGSGCVDGCSGPQDCSNGNTCNPETHRCVCGTRDWGCHGEFSCVDGRCLCGGTLACAPGEACSGGACVCGSQSNPGGRVCEGPNPRCINSDFCGCDDDSICNEAEECKSGQCFCGTEAKPTGPFCEQGKCDPDSSSCVGIPPDLGPDLPPDSGVDQGEDGPPEDAGEDSGADAPQTDALEPDSEADTGGADG